MLNSPLSNVFTASEAEQKWGLEKGTVRSSCVRGKLKNYVELGLVKKSGNTWLLTKEVMTKFYGSQKN
ncbi:helix-turn-helix domain-containing protein [Bacillus mycoides]|uniref:helix-turn-helix domain-containing protein n=1 Tax=Bacillus mycoides TaxID=1405 RepID=UPI00399CC652